MASGALAQNQADSIYYTNASVHIFTPFLDKITPKLEQFLRQNSIKVARTNKSTSSEISIIAVMSETQYAELKNKFDEWKCQITGNHEVRSFIQPKKNAYIIEANEMQKRIANCMESLLTAGPEPQRNRLKRDIEYGSDILRAYEYKINELESKIGTVECSIYVQGKSYRVWNYVNMPGVEYSVFMPDNPKVGISAKLYNGYMFKYVYTEGKNFVTVGVFKAADVPPNDTQMYSDIFNFSFGQDFYSHYAGYGGRTFINPYFGYNVGFLAYSGKDSSLKTVYVSPAFGIEWLKNDIVLIDTKINYMLPFSKNKNLRGLQIATSINFAI